MATYNELQDQIAALQRQAEEARAQELSGAIQQIQTLMAEYGITVADLESGKRAKTGKAKKSAQVQFQDKSGNTWSGRGRMPAWLKGQDKEQFRVG